MAIDPFPFKPLFSIKDLEQFSGTKAHTIRIWEKRYGLLKPQRTETNIRHYDVEELKVLLNVSFLNKNGHKISKIAALERDEVAAKVKELALQGQQNVEVIHTLKLAMLGFDEQLFEAISTKFRERHGFRLLVEEIFVPLLKEVGFLWATNSICPAHEHFVSCLIRRKIEGAIDALPPPEQDAKRTNVLFLPENELHELGLLFLHFVLRCSTERVIYLGQSVPREDLVQLAQMVKGEIRFLSIFTAAPITDKLNAYCNELRELLPEDRCSFMLSGGQITRCEDLKLPNGFLSFGDLNELLTAAVA